jgi:hypothetical protein
MWMALTGTKPEDFKDCMALSKVHDLIDDTFANFWEGYVEHTPRAFEKELKTCPVTKAFSREPEICEVLLAESLKGMASVLNPKFKTNGKPAQLGAEADRRKSRLPPSFSLSPLSIRNP